jgi:hypothetical protein
MNEGNSRGLKVIFGVALELLYALFTAAKKSIGRN